MRTRLVLTGVVCLGLLVGCDGGDSSSSGGTGEPAPAGLAEAHGRWEQADVADYSYLLDAGCGERTLIGRFRITVQDDAVTSADALDEAAQVVINNLGLEYVPTIDDLWEELLQADADGADEARGDFDEELGYPTSITIDWLRNADDDEACYEITEFAGG